MIVTCCFEPISQERTLLDMEDVKIYCPKVGLVRNQDLELVWRGFGGLLDKD